VLAVLVAHSTRLVTLSQVVLGQRAAQSVKAVAMGLAYFLTTAEFPVVTLSPHVLEAAARHLDPVQVATYRGKAVLALDPTEYPKRSRGCGQSKDGKPRPMEHIGRVRAPKPPRKTTQTRKRTKAAGAKASGSKASGSKASGSKVQVGTAARVATTTGYVDVWAGLVLTGKQFFPLARQLFSNRHPDATSQNRVEEAVLTAALGLAERLGWAVIIVADRGLGRKELLIRLVQEGRDVAIRVDADITVPRGSC
jgi:hypothetical protein